jgi:uncharacterized GH25 family protein
MEGKHNKMLIVGLVLSFSLILASVAGAHTMWINLTEYTPKIWSHPKYAPTPRAKIVAYFGWGDRYPLADFLSDKYLGCFFLIRPDGTRKKLTPGKDGFRATELIMKENGGWMVGATIKPGFYGKVKGKKDFYKMRYEQYGKALINVGEVDGNPFTAQVGHKLEIIPLNNPNLLELGDTIQVRVLFEEEPAPDSEIEATSLFGFSDNAIKTTTNVEGEAAVETFDHHGPWIIKAVVRTPPPDDMIDKCQEFYYTATLTFAVGKPITETSP